MANVPFTCACGTVKGVLHEVGKGNHARCFCQSCRAAEIHTGAADPGDRGVTLYQTSADCVSFSTGQDHLAVFSFGPKNLLRWHTSCCGGLLFNTLRSPKFSFAAIRTDKLENTTALGPVRSRGFIPDANDKQRHEGLVPMISGMLWRAISRRINGRWKQTPFFDAATLKPVVAPQILPAGEIAKILAQVR